MTDPKADPAKAFEDHAPTPVRPKFVRQLGQFSAGLLIAALFVFAAGLFAKSQSDSIRNTQLAQINLVEGRIQQELLALNSPGLKTSSLKA